MWQRFSIHRVLRVVSIFCFSSKTVKIILLLNFAYDVRREFTRCETYPVNLKLFSSVRSYDVFFPCKWKKQFVPAVNSESVVAMSNMLAGGQPDLGLPHPQPHHLRAASCLLNQDRETLLCLPVSEGGLLGKHVREEILLAQKISYAIDIL